MCAFVIVTDRNVPRADLVYEHNFLAMYLPQSVLLITCMMIRYILVKMCTCLRINKDKNFKSICM